MTELWSKTYELNEAAWAALYQEQYRKRQNSPLRLLLFASSTIIQLPLVLLYVADMQAGEAAGLVLVSAALCLLSCVNRYASGLSARLRLKQPDSARRYETCRIRIQGESVSITRSGKTIDVPAALLRMDRYRSGLVAISDADSLLTFIPGGAFASEDERSGMLDAFEEARRNGYRRPEEELTDCVPQRCTADYRAVIPEKARTAWERTAWRGLVRTRLWWGPATIVSTVISAANLLLLLSGRYVRWTPLLAIALVVLNLRYIVLFSPLIYRRIEQSDRQAASLLGHGEIRYCFDDEHLVMIGNQMAFDFPRQDVTAVRCHREFGVWYLQNGLVLVIPKPETMQPGAFAALLNPAAGQSAPCVRRGADR